MKNEELARELFAIGIAARREIEGRNDRKNWSALSTSQLAAWESMATYINENFVRKTTNKKGEK